MREHERKILLAIASNPGMLWYEAGIRVYPNCVHPRINIFGSPFDELYGRGLSLTYEAIHSLHRARFIKEDEHHRFRATVRGRTALAREGEGK